MCSARYAMYLHSQWGLHMAYVKKLSTRIIAFFWIKAKFIIHGAPDRISSEDIHLHLTRNDVWPKSSLRKSRDQHPTVQHMWTPGLVFRTAVYFRSIFIFTRWRWKYTATSFAVEPFVESYELFCVVLSLLMEEGSHNGLKEPKTNWSKNPVWKFVLSFIDCITKCHIQNCQCVEFMRHIILMAIARKCYSRLWLYYYIHTFSSVSLKKKERHKKN